MFLIPVADAPNYTARRPWVNWSLIAINVVVFIAGRWVNPAQVDYELWLHDHGYVPLAPRLDALFTSMFLHSGVVHLAGNMLFLYIFGDNVEGRLGHVGYLLTYLACGVAAVLVFHGVESTGAVPLVGASGAIFGVQGFYFLAFPRNRVRFVFWLFVLGFFWVPSRIVLGFFLAGDLVRLLVEQSDNVAGGGVAYAAHVGGFAFGFLLAWSTLRYLPAGEPATRRIHAVPGAARVLLANATFFVKRGDLRTARGALAAVVREHGETPEAAEAAMSLGWIVLRVDGDLVRAAALFGHAADHHPSPAIRAEAERGLAAIDAARASAGPRTV